MKWREGREREIERDSWGGSNGEEWSRDGKEKREMKMGRER